MVSETEDDIGNERKKLKIEKGGNDSLSREDKERLLSTVRVHTIFPSFLFTKAFSNCIIFYVII